MNNDIKRMEKIIKDYEEFGFPKFFIINNGEMIQEEGTNEDENPIYEINTYSDQIKAVKLLNESYSQISSEGKINSGYIDSTKFNSNGDLVIYLNDAGAIRLRELYRKKPSKELLFSQIDKDAVGFDYDQGKLVFKNDTKSHPTLLEQNSVGSSEYFGVGVPDEMFTGRIDDIVESEDTDPTISDSYDYIAPHYMN